MHMEQYWAYILSVHVAFSVVSFGCRSWTVNKRDASCDADAGCVIDVPFVEQKLVGTCNELDEKKADKESILSAVNAVSITACISAV